MWVEDRRYSFLVDVIIFSCCKGLGFWTCWCLWEITVLVCDLCLAVVCCVCASGRRRETWVWVGVGGWPYTLHVGVIMYATSDS